MASVSLNLSDARKLYQSQVVQQGIAAIRSGRGTDEVISAAAQATISTAVGTGGALICGAVTAGIGAAVCGPIVGAVASAILGIVNGIFGGGPTPLQLKKDECEKSATALENQYLQTMMQLLDLEYQLWPERKQEDAADPVFYPFMLTGYAKIEPVGLRESAISIKRWNMLAGDLVAASREEAAYWGLAREQLLFPVLNSWNYKKQQVKFPQNVMMNPIAAFANDMTQGACLSLATPANYGGNIKYGTPIWDSSLRMWKVNKGTCKTKGEISVLNPSNKQVACLPLTSLYSEDPVDSIKRFIDLMKPSSQLIKPALDRVVVNKYAEKSADAIEQETLKQQTLKSATDWLTVQQNFLAAQQSSLHDAERQLDASQGQLRDMKASAHDIKAHEIFEQIEAADRRTRYAWYAAGAIVLGAGILAWRRS
jgi:hypothetical protein